MGLLGWSEQQALSANICSVMGALRSHEMEVLRIHFPQVFRKTRLEEDRKRRGPVTADQFRSWAKTHNTIVSAKKIKPKPKKRKV